MSASVTPQRRRRTVEDVDDEDDWSIDGGSTNTRKRARGNDDHNEDSPEGPLLPNSFRRSPRRRASTDDAPLKYQPGAIVRVKLTNFVTYTSAEFHPGPNLNMIIGPNGTGKSTLVCAVCLGLGSPTSLLGRAKELSEFIKHGSNKAEIEIELAADPTRHETNPVITSRLSRTSKTADFFINGKKVTKKELSELMRTFSIQIGNLCQFLPQDRVVEFAALNPVDLLVQTQQAVASPRMCQWHEELKGMRKEQKEKETQRLSIADHLENLEKRQNGQEADVARLRERQGLQEERAAMEYMRPFCHYRVAKANHLDAVRLKKEANNESTRLTDQLQPNLEAEDKKLAYTEIVEKIATTRGNVIERTETLVTTNSRKHEQKAAELDSNARELEAEKKSAKATKGDMPRLQKTIADLNQTMQSTPPESDFTALNEQVRERLREKREAEQGMQDLHELRNRLEVQMKQQDRVIGLANQEKAESQTQAGQLANKLRGISGQAHKAWEWIKRNQDQFQGKVFGPPVVECSIKDSAYAKAVESSIGQSDMVAFTTTCREDFRMLNRQLYNTMGLNEVNIRSVSTPLSQFRAPCSPEQLQSLGMDSYILDLIEGPDEVLAMLCDNRNIHQTAFTSRELSQRDIDVLSRPNSPLTSWVTQSDTYNITRRREYGDKATSTRVQALRPARVFTDNNAAGHNVQEDADLEQRIADAKRTIRELEGQEDDVKREMAELEQRRQTAQREARDLTATKNAIQTRLSEFNALPTKLEEAKRKLQSAEEKVATSAKLQLDLLAHGDRLTLEKGQIALDYGNSVEALQKLHVAHLEALIVAIEARSDYEQLQSRTQQEKALLEVAQRDVQVAKQRKEHTLVEGKRWQRECEQIGVQARTKADAAREERIEAGLRTAGVEGPGGDDWDGFSPVEKGVYDRQDAEAWDPVRMEVECQSLSARLEMTDGVNGGGKGERTLKEFEERAGKIEIKRRQVEELEEKLVTLAEKLAEVRELWEPELDSLISRISQGFAEGMSGIGCVGEVNLRKPDDFDAWAVQIWVKFRESEALSLLDSHRQSGGERAVSTIFYLMALQEMGRAPFRVVDEINQGMDPRNERLVHGRMVEVASGSGGGGGGSQYFLITPKLLPGLSYERGMRVHCIASGEYMPASGASAAAATAEQGAGRQGGGGGLDFAALARRALEVRGAR